MTCLKDLLVLGDQKCKNISCENISSDNFSLNTGTINSLNNNLSVIGHISSSGNISGCSFNYQCIELFSPENSSNGGFIDFHYDGSTSDFTSRIIESSSGELIISSKLKVEGQYYVEAKNNSGSNWIRFTSGIQQCWGTYVPVNIGDRAVSYQLLLFLLHILLLAMVITLIIQQKLLQKIGLQQVFGLIIVMEIFHIELIGMLLDGGNNVNNKRFINFR